METKDRNRMHPAGNPTRRRRAPARAPRESEAQVVYTPAKPFNRNRFLLHLVTAAAIVLALVLCMSIFFKASQVTVSGTVRYNAWEVREASGIAENDALLGLSRAQIGARIRERLPYVGSVRVGIKLPDTVMIEITELQVVYAVQDAQDGWWLLDASGRVVDMTDAAAAKDHTCIVGVKLQNAVIGEQAQAFESIPETVEGETQPLPVLVTAAQKLDAAVQVLTALEENGIMGNIDTVDVTDPADLTLQYESRYRLLLGDSARLDYKVAAAKAAIAELDKKMGQYGSGELDASFTIWPDKVGFTPLAATTG